MSRGRMLSRPDRSGSSQRLLHSGGSPALPRQLPCGPVRGRRPQPARAAQAGYMRAADMSQTMVRWMVTCCQFGKACGRTFCIVLQANNVRKQQHALRAMRNVYTCADQQGTRAIQIADA